MDWGAGQAHLAKVKASPPYQQVHLGKGEGQPGGGVHCAVEYRRRTEHYRVQNVLVPAQSRQAGSASIRSAG